MATLDKEIMGVKAEVGGILRDILEDFNSLDLDRSSLISIRDSYNLILREAAGLSYDELVDERKLPPFSPSLVFDQKRLEASGVSLLGSVFLPSLPTSNNLRSSRDFYASVGSNLEILEKELEKHPPTDPSSFTFVNASNKFIVTPIAARKADGTLKSEKDIEAETGVSFFSTFIFPELPQSILLVYQEFIGKDEPLPMLSKRSSIPEDQITNSVFWFGGINANSNNLFKMRSILRLPSSQIRSASFGDDIGRNSSSLFNTDIENMVSSLNTINVKNLPSTKTVSNTLNEILKIAFQFLARISFKTSVLNDPFFLEKTRESGVADSELEFSFINRDDESFRGADLEANSLLSTVWPPKDNTKNIQLLSEALQQDPNTPKYTNKELNEAVSLRTNAEEAAKRLVAGTTARLIAIDLKAVREDEIRSLITNTALDIANLSTAYSQFLTPPDPSPRLTGTNTVESASTTLLRASNLVKSLKIKEQIQEFPTDFGNEIDKNLQQVLGVLLNMADAIETYLDVYRQGPVKDLLAHAISIASTTNLLFSDGDTTNNVLIESIPGSATNLSSSISSQILVNQDFPDLYTNVSEKLDDISSVIRGTSENNKIGRLFDLPLIFINSILAEGGGVTLENNQGPAMEQVRSSFFALRRTIPSILRDLGELSNNFRCAFTEAELFVSRTSGSSIENLVSALRQN